MKQKFDTTHIVIIVSKLLMHAILNFCALYRRLKIYFMQKIKFCEYLAILHNTSSNSSQQRASQLTFHTGNTM